MNSSRVKLLGVILLLLIIASTAFTSFFGGKTYTVTYTNEGFVPKEVSIKKGDTIQFLNGTSQDFWPASDLHPTHELLPEFDPKKPINAGSSWSFTFKKRGDWRYHDHLRPTFRGLVKVN